MPIITLTTDFGTRDGYVGAVKGVISRLAPEATIIDIAHDIPRADIAHGAWIVRTSTLEFPPGTVHVVVVDPGVGSERRAVIVRAATPRGPQMFVGPDNGLFAYLDVEKAWQIDDSTLTPVSWTFHGRDVFAPVAASISRMHPTHYGPPVTLDGALPWGRRKGRAGRIVHIDRYGNLITDLPAADATHGVRYGRDTVLPLHRTYADVMSGQLVAYIGSAGTVEIAVRDDRADLKLDAKRGDEVEPIAATTQSQGPYR